MSAVSNLSGPAGVRFGLKPAGRLCLVVVVGYFFLACGVWAGFWGSGWWEISGSMWEPPSTRHWLGTNLLGQDILARAVAATATAFEIGVVVALTTAFVGALAGAAAGFLSHTWIDELLLWIKGTLDAIPFYLFVAAVAFALQGHAWAMHVAMIATFWTGTARVVRAETMRIRQLDFIEAARMSGLRPRRIVTGHILPNLSHVVLVQMTLIFIAAIKAEVILSFLGIGVQDSISWGIMIAEASQEILSGQYMNFIAASGFLFVLVMAFNLLADELQDLLDPRARHWHANRNV